MNYNFTDRVRKVLAMAREEAIRLQHDYVGTEHILLGLIREGEGVAARVERVHEILESNERLSNQERLYAAVILLDSERREDLDLAAELEPPGLDEDF